MTLKEDLGGYPRGEGPRVLAVLTSGTGRLARFGKYAQDLLARESFQATFDEVRAVLRAMLVYVLIPSVIQAYITERYKARFADLRK